MINRATVRQAPYAQDGSLLRFADSAYRWRTCEPFRAPLTLRPHLSEGRGSYVVWEDMKGRRYPMSQAALLDLIVNSTLSQGVTTGWWTITKSGQSYGICRLSGETVARS